MELKIKFFLRRFKCLTCGLLSNTGRCVNGSSKGGIYFYCSNCLKGGR